MEAILSSVKNPPKMELKHLSLFPCLGVGLMLGQKDRKHAESLEQLSTFIQGCSISLFFVLSFHSFPPSKVTSHKSCVSKGNECLQKWSEEETVKLYIDFLCLLDLTKREMLKKMYVV